MTIYTNRLVGLVVQLVDNEKLRARFSEDEATGAEDLEITGEVGQGYIALCGLTLRDKRHLVQTLQKQIRREVKMRLKLDDYAAWREKQSYLQAHTDFESSILDDA